MMGGEQFPRDGWIEHDGRKRPVNAQRKVHIRLRGGADSEAGGQRALPADCYCWHHEGSSADIIAYKIVKRGASS